MVIVVAAAAAAVGFGAYKGGKAAVAGGKTKLAEFKRDRVKDKEYKERKASERQAQEVQDAYEATLSVDDRLARYKRERDKEKSSSSSRGGLGRFRKSGK